MSERVAIVLGELKGKWSVRASWFGDAKQLGEKKLDKWCEVRAVQAAEIDQESTELMAFWCEGESWRDVLYDILKGKHIACGEKCLPWQTARRLVSEAGMSYRCRVGKRLASGPIPGGA